VQETSRTENSAKIAHEQCRHFANRPASSTYPQQQQQKYIVMTTVSTPERTHHISTSVAMSNHHPTTVERSTSQPGLTLMTSCAASRPQLLPVPVERKSFRIDDILGDERVRRDDMQGRPPATTETCKSLTPTDCQTSRQSSDRLTERPPTHDIIHLHRQQQQQRQQHQSSETDERAGNVDAVVLGRRSSSPVTKRSRDSTPDFSSRRRHVTSGGQSSASSPSSQDSAARPADLYVNAVRAIQLRQSRVDQHTRLSPPNVISASQSPCLRRHHRPYQQQQQQFGQVAENAAVAMFGGHHHPLLLIPPHPPPSSTVHCVDSLNTFFAGRHGSVLPGCEFFRFVHSKTKL